MNITEAKQFEKLLRDMVEVKSRLEILEAEAVKGEFVPPVVIPVKRKPGRPRKHGH